MVMYDEYRWNVYIVFLVVVFFVFYTLSITDGFRAFLKWVKNNVMTKKHTILCCGPSNTGKTALVCSINPEELSTNSVGQRICTLSVNGIYFEFVDMSLQSYPGMIPCF